MRHLSDTDIQSYLDGAAGSEARAFDAHLRGCQSCRARLEAYRMLFADLTSDDAIPCLPNLADRVMSRLEPDRRPQEASGRVDLVIAGSSVLLALTALWVFVGLGAVASGIAGLGMSIRDLFGAGVIAGARLSVLVAVVVILLVYIANGVALRRAGRHYPHS